MKVSKVLVTVLVLVAAASFAKANIGLNGVGGMLGYVMPNDIDNTFGFGAAADLGTIMDNVKLQADVTFWKKTYDESGWGGTWEWSWSQFAISGIAKYFFNMPDKAFKPYAGGGLGLMFNKWKSEYSGSDTWGFSGESSDSETDIGVILAAGLEYPLKPGLDGIAEFRYALGDLDVMAIWVGVMYSLSK